MSTTSAARAATVFAIQTVTLEVLALQHKVRAQVWFACTVSVGAVDLPANRPSCRQPPTASPAC